MAREGEVSRVPVGQFEYYQWRLTPLGLELLQSKKPSRRKGKSSEQAASTHSDT